MKASILTWLFPLADYLLIGEDMMLNSIRRGFSVRRIGRFYSSLKREYYEGGKNLLR